MLREVEISDVLMRIWSQTKCKTYIITIHVSALFKQGHCSDCCVVREGNHFDVPVGGGDSILSVGSIYTEEVS